MFYITDLETTEINVAGVTSSLSPDYLDHPIPAYQLGLPDSFHIEHPINLVLIRHCTGDLYGMNMITQISPAGTFYLMDDLGIASTFPTGGHLHKHDAYEIMFVMEGTVYQNIEHSRHVYPKGSCCLMNRNVYHAEEYDGNIRLLFLQLSPALIREIIGTSLLFPEIENAALCQLKEFFLADLTADIRTRKSYIDFIPLASADHMLANIHSSFEMILRELQSRTVSSDYKIRSCLIEILCSLFDENIFHRTSIQPGTTAEQNLFHMIDSYIKEEHGHVTRQALEDQFHYSGDYLYKIIRKYTGLSIFEYGTKCSLKEAASLLVSTDLSVAEIATRLRYSNQTHFYRLFKEEYEMTPSQYRRSMK